LLALSSGCASKDMPGRLIELHGKKKRISYKVLDQGFLYLSAVTVQQLADGIM